MKTSLELTNISFAYGEDAVLSNLSLCVGAGAIVALLGASGCGKSTVLKVIAGMLLPNEGSVLFGGEDFTRVAAEKREAVMMFQKPLLFPYLNVADNIAFGLKMRNIAKDVIAERVEETLKLVQLSGFENRMPSQLSGGQEQRIALARALITRPRVLLLDEPLSALDANLRNEMRFLVRDLLQQLEITTVFVTHDQSEAVTIADHIAFINNGKIEQFGPPDEFFNSPKTVAAAEFFGWKVFEGNRIGNKLKTGIGDFELPCERLNGDSLRIAFHPNSLRSRSENNHTNIIRVRLLKRTAKGNRYTDLFKLQDGSVIQAEMSDLLPDRESNSVDAYLSHDAIIFYE